jgi:hypothetical protein
LTGSEEEEDCATKRSGRNVAGVVYNGTSSDS